MPMKSSFFSSSTFFRKIAARHLYRPYRNSWTRLRSAVIDVGVAATGSFVLQATGCFTSTASRKKKQIPMNLSIRKLFLAGVLFYTTQASYVMLCDVYQITYCLDVRGQWPPTIPSYPLIYIYIWKNLVFGLHMFKLFHSYLE